MKDFFMRYFPLIVGVGIWAFYQFHGYIDVAFFHSVFGDVLKWLNGITG